MLGRKSLAVLTVAAVTVLLSGYIRAEEPLTQRIINLAAAPNALPKGSYTESCQCQMSGGVTLMCLCANIDGKTFPTTIDVRNCPLPKDIRNCNGYLKCTEPKTGSC